MKLLLHALCLSCFAAFGHAQEKAAGDAMGQLAKTAEQDLAKGIEELNRLREQIAGDKLPLAQELTSLEERVSQLRHDNDKAARLADQSNLEVATLNGTLKAKQDEIDYVGKLLDDYARTFESKVGPCETQYCAEVIEAAKQAGENTTLTVGQRFEKQLALATVSIQRVAEAIGGMRFPGIGVDLQGMVSEGQFAVIGPIALFRAKSGIAGLVVPQTGSTKPLIRPLEGALQAGIISLVDTGEGALPLDPSRGGALKALVQKTNIIHIFEKGGPIMWPLLLASILALGTVIERLMFLASERRKREPQALEGILAEVAQGNIESAIQIGKKSRFYVTRALGYALEHKGQSLPNALLYAQAQELKRFRRGIPILDTVITLAPLLGLLGTVTGMMSSFSLIGGDLSAPGAITGGIAEALIATAFGLGIAITALLPFNFLNTKLDEASHELESAAAQLELLVLPRPESTSTTPAPTHGRLVETSPPLPAPTSNVASMLR